MGEAPSNVFAFGEGASVDTLSTDVALVGGKAASLALMTALHLIALGLVCGLVIYLLLVLFNPEDYS